MRYVKRDDGGQIVAIYAEPQPDASEEIGTAASELWEFVGERGDEAAARAAAQAYLRSSDVEMARVVEDLIDILIDKGALRLTDFSDAAQDKLLRRREARGSLSLDNPLSDETLSF